jgi:hypothetical protein
MKIRVILFGALFLFITMNTSSSIAYEPSYEELLVKKRKLAVFCDQFGNNRKYDICVVFEKARKKLPSNPTEEALLKRAYDKTAE